MAIFQHLLHPIPPYQSTPQPQTQEQRLETILVNLEKQRNAVRSRILASAKRELAAYNATHATSSNPPATTPSPLDFLPSLPGNPANQASVNNNCPSASPAEPGQIKSPPQEVAQVETPFDVQLTLRTMQQLEEYDAHCQRTREPYARELARLKEEREAMGGGAEARDPRLVARKQSMGAMGNGGMGGGDVDVSRDPRRRP